MGVEEDIASLQKKIEELTTQIKKPKPPELPFDNWGRFWQFVGSGFFFMIVGAIFLALANHYMGHDHAAFSFVMVVVGVAVFLYGTGTQGIGEFNSDASTAKYKVALAGGAGVLAFCVAYGIVEYHGKMKEAFRVERKYVWVTFSGSDGGTSLASFRPKIEIDGVATPVRFHRNDIDVLMPYLSTEFRAEKEETAESVLNGAMNRNVVVTGNLSEVKKPPVPKNDLPIEERLILSRTVELIIPDASADKSGTLQVEPRTAIPFIIKYKEIKPRDGWLDFPRVERSILVTFKDRQQARNAIAQTDSKSNALQAELAPKVGNVPDVKDSPLFPEKP